MTDSAVKCHEEGLEAARQVRDGVVSLMHLSKLGALAVKVNDIPRATVLFRECLAAVAEQGDSDIERRMLLDFGEELLLDHDATKMAGYLMFVHALGTKVGSPELELRALELFPDVHLTEDEGEDCVRFLESVLTVARRNGAVAHQTEALLLLGSALREDVPERAARYHRDALELVSSAGDLRLQIVAMEAVGAECLVDRQYEEATRLFKNALRLSQQLGEPHREGICIFRIAEVHAAQGHWEQALELARSGIALVADKNESLAKEFEGIMLGWHSTRSDERIPPE